MLAVFKFYMWNIILLSQQIGDTERFCEWNQQLTEIPKWKIEIIMDKPKANWKILLVLEKYFPQFQALDVAIPIVEVE